MLGILRIYHFSIIVLKNGKQQWNKKKVGKGGTIQDRASEGFKIDLDSDKFGILLL